MQSHWEVGLQFVNLGWQRVRLRGTVQSQAPTKHDRPKGRCSEHLTEYLLSTKCSDMRPQETYPLVSVPVPDTGLLTPVNSRAVKSITKQSSTKSIVVCSSIFCCPG